MTHPLHHHTFKNWVVMGRAHSILCSRIGSIAFLPFLLYTTGRPSFIFRDCIDVFFLCALLLRACLLQSFTAPRTPPSIFARKSESGRICREGPFSKLAMDAFLARSLSSATSSWNPKQCTTQFKTGVSKSH